MGRRKKQLPHAVQAILVWFVFSTLLTMGLLYLRATESLSDRVFQPLAPVLCKSDERLETSYRVAQQARRRDFGDSRRAPQQSVWTLDVAECVGRSGAREPAPLFGLVVWLALATGVGCLGLLGWVGRRQQKRTARTKPPE
jgi:hypothetical protein